MNNLKKMWLTNERGSVSLYAMVSVLILLTILLSTYIYNSHRHEQSLDVTRQIKMSYEQGVDRADEIYAGLVQNNVKKIDYVVCTGSQYIDTGFRPNQNTTVEMKLKINDNSSHIALWGARLNYMSNTFTCFALDNHTIRFDYSTEQKSAGSTPSGTFTIKQAKNLGYVDGAQKTTATSATFTSAYNLYLFGTNTSRVGRICKPEPN